MADTNKNYEHLKRQFDTLDTNFMIAVSILSAACGILLILALGSYVWLISLSKRIGKGTDTFTIERPKLRKSISSTLPQGPIQGRPLPPVNPPRNTFDNPNFTRNPLSNSNHYYTPADNINYKSNNIQTPKDNGNFSFGPQYTSEFRGETFKTPAVDYRRDSKFY